MIALFSNFKFTTRSGKHLGKITHAHIVSVMYNLLTWSRGSDDSSIGFDRDRNRRQRELTNYKNLKSKYHVRIYLREYFGFTEDQEKGTYGLGYRLIVKRNNDNAVLNKDNAINRAKIKINIIECYVPQYTASIPQQPILSEQILSKVPAEFQ